MCHELGQTQCPSGLFTMSTAHTHQRYFFVVFSLHTTQGLLWIVPLQRNLELEQCRPGKHMCHEQGKPSVAQTL